MAKIYLPRAAETSILRLTKQFPAVSIIGPRQVGKTSLAKHVMTLLDRKSVYLDLESQGDLNKLSDPELYLSSLSTQTVILDEVQRVPALFSILRGLIDKHRVAGRFILLGSASPELIRDASESLAGRIAYYKLNPFSFSEVSQKVDYQTHWLRGGFPDSLLSEQDTSSMEWREYFIQTYLERDLPLLGLAANPVLTRRLWTMLAHWNGNLLKYESLSNSLGISGPTVRRYIDFLESAFLIRRVQPWFANIRKRIVKTPKVYLRDTGVLHTLLSIGSFDQLQSSPAIGASWEAYIIQEIVSRLPPRYEMCFYRTQDGTEADLVLVKSGVPDVIVEIKYSSTPIVTKSMRIAATDLKTSRQFIVAPVSESYPVGDGYEVLSNLDLDRLFE